MNNRCKVALGMLHLYSLPHSIRCDLEEGHSGDHQTLQSCIVIKDVTDTSLKIFDPKSLDSSTLTWHNREHERAVGNLGSEDG